MYNEIVKLIRQAIEISDEEAKIVENPQDQVKHPFMAPILAELNLNRDGIFDRKYIKIQDNVGEFTFKSGTTIEDMIEE